MDLTPEAFEDVIGACALDACDADEVVAIDAYVAAHPEAAAEVERLRAAAAALGAAGAQQPPRGLRDRLVLAASDRVAPVTAREALDDETERFSSLLGTLGEADLDAVTENGLSVRDLVAHVEAIDRAFVTEADAQTGAFIGADEVATITADTLPAHAGEDFAQTVTRFRRTRADLAALSDRYPREHRVAGYSRDSTLVIRVFETWTHHDDIERALGRPVTVPAPSVMRRMADLAMGSLPLAMAVRGTARPDRTARFVLSGPGGGEWTVACGPGATATSTPDVVVKTSVVQWCRRFSDRVAPDAMDLDIEGDSQLARELVGAANAFAGL